MISCMNLLVAVVIIGCFLETVVSTSSKRPIPKNLKEKWNDIYDFADRDGDGAYSLADEFDFATKLIDFYNATGNQVDGFTQYANLYKDAIDAFYGANSGKTSLTRSEYLQVYGHYWNHHYVHFLTRLAVFFDTIFHATDSDGDGVVSFDEFKAAYDIYGDPEGVEKKAKKAFKLIDRDGDKSIQANEFIDINLDFHLDPDSKSVDIPLY